MKKKKNYNPADNRYKSLADATRKAKIAARREQESKPGYVNQAQKLINDMKNKGRSKWRTLAIHAKKRRK